MKKLAEARQQRTQQVQESLAAARQVRLEKHQELLERLQAERVIRQQEIQQFLHERQLHQRDLHEQGLDRANQVKEELKRIRQTRIEQANIDAQARVQAVEDFLLVAESQRMVASDVLKQELIDFTAQISTETAVILEMASESRRAMAEVQMAELATFRQDLQQDVAEMLDSLGAEREVAAVELRQSLAEQALHMEVWGNAEADPAADLIDPVSTDPAIVSEDPAATPDLPMLDLSLPEGLVIDEASDEDFSGMELPVLDLSLPEDLVVDEASDEDFSGMELPMLDLSLPEDLVVDEVVEEEPSISTVEPEPILEAVSDPVAETVVWEPVDTQTLILEYVGVYVGKLQETNPKLTLLQVIGNRELVRELLARGAVDLGVDPAEILVVLRRMVSTSASL